MVLVDSFLVLMGVMVTPTGIMIVLVWNVRGLNDPGKVANVKRLLYTHPIDVLGILEIKVKEHKVTDFQRKFGPAWSWICIYSCSDKGRIWVGWQADNITLDVLSINEQFIHCAVCNKDLSSLIYCTIIYGLYTIHDILTLWDGIKTLFV